MIDTKQQPKNQQDNIASVVHWRKITADENLLVLVTRKVAGGYEAANETWSLSEGVDKSFSLIIEFKKAGAVYKESYRLLSVLGKLKDKEILEDD